MRAKEYEEAVLELENVRIVLRCAASTVVPDYAYERKAAGNSTINEWLNSRVLPHIGVEIAVIDGFGGNAIRRMKMSTLRDSYAT